MLSSSFNMICWLCLGMSRSKSMTKAYWESLRLYSLVESHLHTTSQIPSSQKVPQMRIPQLYPQCRSICFDLIEVGGFSLFLKTRQNHHPIGIGGCWILLFDLIEAVDFHYCSSLVKTTTQLSLMAAGYFAGLAQLIDEGLAAELNMEQTKGVTLQRWPWPVHG